MSDLTAPQKELLRRLSAADDVDSARLLCRSFLQETDHAAPAASSLGSAQEIFLRLLSGESCPAENCRTRLGSYFSEKDAPCSVFVIIPDTAPAACDIRKLLSDAFPDFLCVNYLDRAVCLSRFHENRESPVMKRLYTLLQKHGLLCGVSRPFSDPAAIREAYEEALDTLKTMRILDYHDHLAFHDYYLMIRILDHLPENTNLEKFIIPDIRGLQHYDETHHTELCKTLLCYLNNSRNVNAAASELHVHRNTVHYRVNKCISLLSNINFEDERITFMTQIALNLVEFSYYRQRRKELQSTLLT